MKKINGKLWEPREVNISIPYAEEEAKLMKQYGMEVKIKRLANGKASVWIHNPAWANPVGNHENRFIRKRGINMKHLFDAANEENERMTKRFKNMEHTTDQVILHNKHNGQPLDANNAWGKTKEETTKILGEVKTI